MGGNDVITKELDRSEYEFVLSYIVRMYSWFIIFQGFNYRSMFFLQFLEKTFFFFNCHATVSSYSGAIGITFMSLGTFVVSLFFNGYLC